MTLKEALIIAEESAEDYHLVRTIPHKRLNDVVAYEKIDSLIKDPYERLICKGLYEKLKVIPVEEEDRQGRNL